ncbi:DNA topoisomerase-1 [Mycoplasma testudineum]|uniref:DNA topoisomerase 1 n=1 Tax=Mycoplasma testudineum TaxID=244584 RepID=A0A4R6IFL2_9MOLU|nr:type I DNA topoisomerase [Mycoplasma testudineum]OYD27108.1 DNA topoisomerase I [Mycoplasma testudineum]TDO21140.1 DNA topoisomerase-1 [Mycoplasma testudineum]
MSKLVIVESPNKVKAIQKYLGDEYIVKASVGHIAKLPASGKYRLGIDLENWEPKYVVDPVKKNVVKELEKVAEKSDMVIIATDPDREGEAIGQHLVDFLKLENKHKRVRYNEITKLAISNAFKNLTDINHDLVKAQKVRRMLDRIIGFRLSNLMKYKFNNAPTNPSAGRVQSIALKLVVDREKLIDAFIPEKYFYIAAWFDSKNYSLLYLDENKGDKNWIVPNDVDLIFDKLKNEMVVSSIKKTTRKDAKSTPFKQAAFYKKSSLSAARSQSSAQRLFEGYGDDGLITYPRTDSTFLSQTFLEQAKEYITKKHGSEYWDGNVKVSIGDQNAHEGIRPTDLSLTPKKALEKYKLNSDDYKTYALIYENTLKAIMSQPSREYTTYNFTNGGYNFTYSQSNITFDGYFKAIGMPNIDGLVLDAKVGDVIKLRNIEKQEKFTQPPARFNDGSLIETLDNIKVGRPSTFATTVKLIKSRQYVEKNGQQLIPTQFGKEVVAKLIDGFPNIINEDYTAKVEAELDEIADGKLDYKPVMQDFWNRFDETLEFAYQNLDNTVLLPTFTGQKCPLDNGDLIFKNSKFGEFIGCINFPNCQYRKSKEKNNKTNSILAKLKKSKKTS